MKLMNKAITQQHLQRITEIIREWPIEKKLTWNNICEASEFELGYIPTRQTLFNKAILVNAYRIRKNEIRSKITHSEISVPKSMAAALEQIVKLTHENDQLKAEINQMAMVAQRLIHNASLHGLSYAKLMEPLSKVDHRG